MARRRDAAAIWAVTLVIHGLALFWFGWHLNRRGPATADLLSDDHAADPAIAVPDERGLIDISDLAEVALIDDSMIGALVDPRSGPADQIGTADGTHPLPDAEVDLPGVSAAGRGGGATAGADSYTGRRDPDTLRTQFWTDPSRYLVPHTRTADSARATSPELLARRSESGYGDRSPHRRATEGAARAVAGTPGAAGTGGVSDETDRMWRDADPRFDGGRAPVLAQAIPGATRPGKRLMVETGTPASEAERVGALRDPVDAASASNARTTGPLELSHPSSGGRAQDGGVAGARGSGPLADSPHAGDGTAASTASLATGRGRESLRAARTDPYFRRFYERLDREVVFPHQLALALEQGDLVVTFNLSVDSGAISHLQVVKSSGFAEFDAELKRALAAIGPLGPVPRALRGRGGRLVVTAPYAFKSPLIR